MLKIIGDEKDVGGERPGERTNSFGIEHLDKSWLCDAILIGIPQSVILYKRRQSLACLAVDMTGDVVCKKFADDLCQDVVRMTSGRHLRVVR